MTAIAFVNLQAQYSRYKDKIDDAMRRVVESCQFIGGEEIASLERNLAAFCGAPHAIACSSGTDGLLLALMALDVGPGDEVITTPFTFIATAEVVALRGAVPIFVDIEETTYAIDAARIAEKITSRTKAIIPVSLYGQPADMDEIVGLAAVHGLTVIEDGAQSFGAEYKGRRSCGLSRLAATSFFPSKPLGCYGDGGAVFTDDEELAAKMRSLLNHGQGGRYEHAHIGLNARMDGLQAAVLNAKLEFFPEEIRARQALAARYGELLKGTGVALPFVKPDRTSVWAQYSIRVQNRDGLVERLRSARIPTAVYYPKPLHLQKAFASLGGEPGDFPVAEAVSRDILSLPMSAFLTHGEQDRIAAAMEN